VIKPTNKARLYSVFASTLRSVLPSFVLGSTTLLSTLLYATDTNKVSIKVMEDARIFAQLDDEIPAVVNYFTQSNETAIVAFYEAQYGQATSSDRRRGRLEKAFTKDDYTIKVIISEQNNLRQVDVLVTQ